MKTGGVGGITVKLMRERLPTPPELSNPSHFTGELMKIRMIDGLTITCFMVTIDVESPF